MKTNSVLLVLVSIFFVSCASTGPTGGALFHEIKYGKYATPVKNASKTGEACQTSILSMVATGDASVDQAKRLGGITEVSSIDASSFSVLGFFNKYCTIVKGN